MGYDLGGAALRLRVPIGEAKAQVVVAQPVHPDAFALPLVEPLGNGHDVLHHLPAEVGHLLRAVVGAVHVGVAQSDVVGVVELVGHLGTQAHHLGVDILEALTVGGEPVPLSGAGLLALLAVGHLLQGGDAAQVVGLAVQLDLRPAPELRKLAAELIDGL